MKFFIDKFVDDDDMEVSIFIDEKYNYYFKKFDREVGKNAIRNNFVLSVLIRLKYLNQDVPFTDEKWDQYISEFKETFYESSDTEKKMIMQHCLIILDNVISSNLTVVRKQIKEMEEKHRAKIQRR